MKSTSALEKFLQICEKNHMDGSGHSLEVLSISEINRSSEVDTPNSNDVLQSEAVNSSENPEHSGLSASGRACLSSSSDGNRVAGDGTGRENVAIDQDADQGLASANVVQETPPEEYNAPVAHSTPSPYDDAVGFWIDPDEISDDLKEATVRIARKYLMK